MVSLHPDLNQLALLARIDELSSQLDAWCDRPSAWQALRTEQFFVRRVLERLGKIRARLAAPLVVATFGATGTGKSALVNALVGGDVTRSGRRRPTTTRPVLVVGAECDLGQLGFDAQAECEVVPAISPVLEQMVLLDCPDPNTSESAGEGTNLDRLRRMLPHVDVLLCTATQETYASNRVLEELAGAAEGCCLVFVQTRADLDSDIRDDWRARLDPAFEVPEMFFVDSVRAMEERKSGQPPTGEFARLVDLLMGELAASERTRVRWANSTDLVTVALRDATGRIGTAMAGMERLERRLATQRDEATKSWLAQIQSELTANRGLWERRLLVSVSQQWSLTPLGLLMKFSAGVGGWFASLALVRARSAAQIALIGATEGLRRLSRDAEDASGETRFLGTATGLVDEARLHALRIVALGDARDAGLDVVEGGRMTGRPSQDAELAADLLRQMRTAIDGVIEDTTRSSGRVTRFFGECLLVTFLGYALWKPARNFFYEHPWLDRPLISSDYYIHALLFGGLLAVILVLLTTRALRKGLARRLPAALQRIQGGSQGPLHPDLELAVSEARAAADELMALRNKAESLGISTDSTGRLGRRHFVRPTHAAVVSG